MAGLYANVAVASTFSPRFMAVLAEADRIARRFEAKLSIIHADEENADRSGRFEAAMRHLNRNEATPVLWQTGQSPADAIVGACRENAVDLLLAGALERDSERFFVGGVARELLRRAPCDLLLFPKPEELETEIDKVVVEVDLKNLSIPILNKACAIASRLGARQMTFFAVVTPFDEAPSAENRPKVPANEDEFAEMLDAVEGFDGEADGQIIRSNTGYSACEFVEGSGARLLIVGDRIEEGNRVLPARMDWLMQVIPTNVWRIGDTDRMLRAGSESSE